MKNFPILEVFFALQTSFLAILVPLSLSFSKNLILELNLNKNERINKEREKIINFWFFSDFLMSATAFFGGYSLVIGFLILFKINGIQLIFRIISVIYWLWIYYSLWKVLENRVFITDEKEKWNLGGLITILYLLIWNIFFVIIYLNMLDTNYKNILFWLSIKSVMLFLVWYAGGLFYFPLTSLYRLKFNMK